MTKWQYQPVMNPNHKSSQTIFAFLSISSLVISIGLGVSLVQDRQIFSQKAKEPDTAAAKIAEIAKEIGQGSSQNTAIYTSKNLGFQLSFDKNYWEAINATDLTKPDLTKISLALKGNIGKAEVTFETFKLAQGSLDSLAALLQRETGALSKEKVTKNGRDFYVLTYNQVFLNQKTPYYKYITINGGNYHVITAKSSEMGGGKIATDQLIDSFSFLPQSPRVRAASTDETPVTALDESKIVELTKPSVFEIAHLFCNNVNFPNLTGTKYLKANYTFCDGTLGSGFAINKDGFIATNGHVAKNYPEEALVRAFSYGSAGIKPFANDLIREVALAQTGQEITPEAAQSIFTQIQNDASVFQIVMTLIYKMIEQKVMVLAEDQNRYFVKLANDPLVVDTQKSGVDILNAVTPSETVKEASFVAANYPNQYSIGAVLNGKTANCSDVAIIKIANPGTLVFPSVKIGTSDGLKEGSDVIVIGYPGLVSGGSPSDTLINQKSSATPTITRGIISAIKNDQSGLKLIQVDASIDHGSSGGPAFDAEGRAIGIATYGLGSQSGNYNFLRDIEDLKKLAADNSVDLSISPTYNFWSEGLNFFWVAHFKQAEIPFGQVEKDYPIHPSVATYIADSQTAIQKGQDKSELVFLLTHDLKTQLTAAGIVLGILMAGIFLGIFMKKRNGGQRIPPPRPYSPPPTYQTSFQTSQFSPNGPLANNV